MKRNSEIRNTESLLKDFKVLKAICSNPNLSVQQQETASYKVNNIELAVNALSEDEIKLINLKYFDRLQNKQVAFKLKQTPEYISTKSKNIIIKLNRCMAV